MAKKTVYAIHTRIFDRVSFEFLSVLGEAGKVCDRFSDLCAFLTVSEN